MRSKARRRAGADAVSFKAVLAALPPSPNIVELGANNGTTVSSFFAGCTPARYVAVDADPRNAAPLRAVVAALSPAVVRLYAPVAVVGPDRGPTIQLRLSERRADGRPMTASSTVMQPVAHLTKFPYVVFPTSVEVPTVTLEALLLCAGLDHGVIDLLWLDIEGAEQEVLKGLTDSTLARINAINMEAFEAPLHAGAWSRTDAVAWLTERGFTLRAVAGQDVFLTR